jgi:hypothetical protein
MAHRVRNVPTFVVRFITFAIVEAGWEHPHLFKDDGTRTARSPLPFPGYKEG